MNSVYSSKFLWNSVKYSANRLGPYEREVIRGEMTERLRRLSLSLSSELLRFEKPPFYEGMSSTSRPPTPQLLSSAFC